MKSKPKSKIITPMKAIDILEIISYQWARTKDIMDIGCCGKVRAIAVKDEIQQQIKTETGKDLPKHLVPMSKVVEYFNIDISYLKKVAKAEKEVRS